MIQKMNFNKTTELMWDRFSKEFGEVINKHVYFKSSCDPKFNYAIEFFSELMWIRVIEVEDNSDYDYVSSQFVNQLYF